MAILFYSSSETYEQQSMVSTLDKILAKQPLKEQLSTIHFTYGSSEVSVQAMGYSKFVEFFLRKGAHFFTYFAMGIFIYTGVRGYFGKKRLALWCALLIPLVFATSDEFHQYLTGGRTPLAQDVILDFCGAIIGVALTALIWRKIVKKHNKI
ncbi:VanZ family protein [Listeria sp. PSOL-1]|uniref:VanZ family protein n=1 Tax=Listeria sp. PSOL-1 TaxID=1844999 RepID=UPI0013D75D34|nr:VanZ family protein [Listeria sp. PSOL-1]